MDVRIQSIHFDASEQLQAFIQKKTAKLERFYDDIRKVEVSLKVVKPETAENKEAALALAQLPKLRGTEVHSSVILSRVDENVFKKLGVNLTCEPQYQTKKLYHG